MSGYRILHLEDDLEFQMLVRLILRSKADVISVDSIAGARSRLAEERFDLLIVDGELPDGLGLSLLEDRHLLQAMPVILFSGRRWEGIPAGRLAFEFVKTEASNEQLVGAVTQLLN